MSSEDIPVSTTPQTNTSEVRQKRTYHMVFVGDFGSESLSKRTVVDADSFADVLAVPYRPHFWILRGDDEAGY